MSSPDQKADPLPVAAEADTDASALEKAPETPPAATATSSSDEREIRGIRWFLICLALYVSALMYGLDTTIAADVQGAVVGTFADDVAQLAWIGAGFPLGSVAAVLPYGFLFTAFNMKWLYVAGIVLFQAGSALCGAAPSMGALVVGRVLAGVGGTGIYLGGLNHFSAMTTRRERSVYLTGTGFVWGVGAILGPVAGGGFSVSPATWRWGFYINLVIGALTAPIYLFCLPSIDPAPGKSLRERAAALDYLGFVLSAATWVFFAVGFVFAGGRWAWDDGRSITFVVLFGVLLASYTLQQYFCIFTTPDTRSFPGHLLRSRTQVLLYITTSCANAAMFFTTFYIPIYFQFTRSDDSLMAAVRLLPFLLVLITFNLATGWALPKIGYYMPVCLVSGAIMTLAAALFLGYLSPTTPPAYIYGFSVLMGVGSGITMQLGYAVASLKVSRPADVFGAINMQNIAQIGATVICLVVAGQAFQTSAVRNLDAALAGRGYSRAQLQAMVSGTESALFDSLSGELRAKVIDAVVAAMRRAFVIPLVAGAVSIVSAVLMRRERLFA
ncbi:uncharacterized protein THITE_2037905 [Thermothielavioides terrestris NRRL 8126]|uniref:Major facilitator superfamily (MFS) profile domain-containing protein n=1 Tax=Thermothielavioides terrestris (strain ATCC 38088 / NRRL 8126) TaxID=578455 RepID=G2QQN0_THETT|nr:uncharacterized protein THITE_2037905 [Thermothielavioides terrestris NRRL 8126]AEO62440.1 hypothetical protein THITE_2037905 [Thermothielavioides terrestris NRRL 8126]